MGVCVVGASATKGPGLSIGLLVSIFDRICGWSEEGKFWANPAFLPRATMSVWDGDDDPSCHRTLPNHFHSAFSTAAAVRRGDRKATQGLANNAGGRRRKGEKKAYDMTARVVVLRHAGGMSLARVKMLGGLDVGRCQSPIGKPTSTSILPWQ